jgi:hypothetical protein
MVGGGAVASVGSFSQLINAATLEQQLGKWMFGCTVP